MNILFYADSPTCTTGFGIVANNIIKRLLQHTDAAIDVLGINERGDHHELRWEKRLKITPAFDGREVHGRMKLIQKLAQGGYDHVIMIHDLITILQPLDQNGASVVTAIEKLQPFQDTKYHLYFPVDTRFEEDGNLEEYYKLHVFDSLIPYTQFAKEQVKKAFPYTKVNLTEPMYHGVNTDEFYPIARPQRKRLKEELWNLNSKQVVVSVIARNQWRKDIATSIHTFKELKKHIPDAFLYLHSRPIDIGGDFTRYLNLWKLEKGKDYEVVSDLDLYNGIPTERLNEIYNATDVLLSSAHGEGFGLPYLEALATKTAVMTPATGVEEELLPKEYVHSHTGLLYESQGVDGLPFRRTYVNDPKAVALEIKNLLENEHLPKIKEEQYNIVKERYDWDTEVQKLINMLQ